MHVSFAHYYDRPAVQHAFMTLLANVMAARVFPAPIYLATVYLDHIDMVLTDGSTQVISFPGGLPSLSGWAELRVPQLPHEDRRIELSARVIVGESK